MSRFYIKNNKGDFLPVELSSIMSKDLNNRLVIVRVGTDEYPVSMSDLELTVESFSSAGVLQELSNVSIIVTPYQIDVGTINKSELENKCIYIQIISGDDISALDEEIKELYRRLNKNFDVAILPSPMTVKDYRQVQDTLKRCQIRRDRRSKSKV